MRGRSETRSRSTSLRSFAVPILLAVGIYAVAMSLTGCGATKSSGRARVGTAPLAVTAPTQVSAGAPAKPTSARTKAVLDQVNIVCSAVLHGWPAALRRPYTVVKLTRYAHAAGPPATRVEVSLLRLQRLGDARALNALALGWRQLQALLGAAASVAAHPTTAKTLGGQLVTHQQALGAFASHERLPACAVAVPR